MGSDTVNFTWVVSSFGGHEVNYIVYDKNLQPLPFWVLTDCG
jgi:hypothetical protein